MRIPWRLLLAVGIAQSVLAAGLSYGFTVLTGRSVWTLQADNSANVAYILVMNLVYWNGFVLVTPAALWLGRRYRLDRTGWRRAVVMHIAGAAAFSSAQIVQQSVVRTALQAYVGIDSSLAFNLSDAFLRTFDWGLALYCGIVGLQHAVDYYSEMRARDLSAAQLETRLVEAQLQALQRQLQPHFLFNTLHAISALVYRDPGKADEMIERLSDLLRLTLHRVALAEVPLDDEVEYVRAYLAIEAVHFGERLAVRWCLDPRARGRLVPNLLLQPLVENAIRHGLEPRRQGGTIEIAASMDGDRLLVQVSDNGCGPGVDMRERVGLGNTRERLVRLYGTGASLEVSPRRGGGTEVTVRVPGRPAAAEEAIREESVA
jgi:signal transduction histidine kinase